MKIGRYQNSKRFGTLIKKELKINHSNSTLNNHKTSTLESHLVRIRFTLDQKHTDYMMDSLAHNGIIALEKVVSPMYDCEGLSESINNNDEFWDVFERYKCELTLPTIPAPLHMAAIISSSIAIQHQLNAKARGFVPPTSQQKHEAKVVRTDAKKSKRQPMPVANTSIKPPVMLDSVRESVREDGVIVKTATDNFALGTEI